MIVALVILAILVFIALAGSGPFWLVEAGTGLAGAGAGIVGGIVGLVVAVIVGAVALVIAGIVALVAGPFALVVALVAVIFALVVATIAVAAGLLPIVLPVALVLGVVWLIARRPAPPRDALALPPPQPR